MGHIAGWLEQTSREREREQGSQQANFISDLTQTQKWGGEGKTKNGAYCVRQEGGGDGGGGEPRGSGGLPPLIVSH